MTSMTIEALKEAIGGLPENDKAALASWLNAQTMDDWDRQMQRDFSPGGKGKSFLNQAKREIAEGQVRPIEQGFAERRGRPLEVC
jgi:hypothetical protein